MEDKRTVLLIDLSALYHSAHHVVAENESITRVQELTIGGVRKAVGMVEGDPLVAICCDSRKSWRKELYADYKAHREAKPQSFYSLFEGVQKTLTQEGYLLWTADGFEADDVIAAACDAAQMAGHRVVVASHDKDLCQLANDNVTILRTHDWKFMTAEQITDKFGVTPFQLGDYLALMGDTSDNVPGCKGVGAKSAAELIQLYGSISRLYDAVLAKDEQGEYKKDPATGKYLHNHETILEPFWKSHKAIRANLADCYDAVMLSRTLVGLAANAPVKFEEIYEERKPQRRAEAVTSFDDDFGGADIGMINRVFPEAKQVQPERKETKVADSDNGKEKPEDAQFVPASSVSPGNDSTREQEEGRAKRPEVTALVVAEFTKQLEPQTSKGALAMAKVLYESRLYGKYRSEEEIFAAMARGRVMGYGGAEALDLFWPMDTPAGRVLAPKAHLVIHLAESHPSCDYFIMVESTTEKATYAVRRKSWPQGREVVVTYTIEDAVQTGLTTLELQPKPEGKDSRGPWQKNRKEMLRKTCGVQAARIVFPGAGLGLTTVEEYGGE